MNLHGIVRGAITSVNPDTLGRIWISTGEQAMPGGGRKPTYQKLAGIPMQVQPMTYTDLMKTDGLNIQGERRSIYVNGRLDGAVRPLGKGGDLIIIDTGVHAGVWLVVQLLEQYPDWCKVCVTLQNQPVPPP